MKNTMYTGKCLIQFISLSQKGCFVLYNENKIVFYFKKGCFIGPQNQPFRLKKGSFSQPESAKRGCFPNLGTSAALVGSGGGKWTMFVNSLVLEIVEWNLSGEIVLIWMSLGLVGDKSALIQVTTRCRQVTSQYLSQWLPSSNRHGVNGPWEV